MSDPDKYLLYEQFDGRYNWTPMGEGEKAVAVRGEDGRLLHWKVVGPTGPVLEPFIRPLREVDSIGEAMREARALNTAREVLES